MKTALPRGAGTCPTPRPASVPGRQPQAPVPVPGTEKQAPGTPQPLYRPAPGPPGPVRLTQAQPEWTGRRTVFLEAAPGGLGAVEAQVGASWLR